MTQYLVSQQNLDRDNTIIAVRNFPSDWVVEYIKVDTPEAPDYWNSQKWGPWHPMTLVRCLIPSTLSYFNLRNRKGGHYVVIGFGQEGSDRMGLRPPYNRIYFYRLI